LKVSDDVVLIFVESTNMWGIRRLFHFQISRRVRGHINAGLLIMGINSFFGYRFKIDEREQSKSH